jgi:preprotein translocase subunit SecB
MNSGINPENTAVWRKNEVDMPTTSFKGYNIVEFSFANKLPPGAQIQLENKYQFNVKYASNKTCVGEMSIRVADRSNAESFFVSLLLRGVFTFTPGTAKEEIHIETYKTLFPYARAYISTVTAGAGIPPIIIPEVDIESQSIYRFDIKPKDS